jgi:hypothetical protein
VCEGGGERLFFARVVWRSGPFHPAFLEGGDPLDLIVHEPALLGQYAEALDGIRPLALVSPEDVIPQGRMGRTAAAAGDTATAQQVSVWLGDQDTPYLFGEDAVWRARIAAILGEREQAVAFLREALARGLHHGMWFHRDNSLESFRGYAPFDEIAFPHSRAGTGG